MLSDGMTPKNRRFLLVYGSETGQAQAIAEEIAEKAPEFGLEADLYCLDQTGKRFNFEDEKCAVIISSTTGDGDPPANASKFMRRIKKRTLSDTYLAHLQYTILGLGDTNYSNFCRCPRDMDKRLEQLGAKRFYPTGLADDGVGLEVVAEPWLEGLYPALQKFLSHTDDDSPASDKINSQNSINGSSESVTDCITSISLIDSKSLKKEVEERVGEGIKEQFVNGADSKTNFSADKSDNVSERTGSNTNQDICDSLCDSNSSGNKLTYLNEAPSSDESVCKKVDIQHIISDEACSLYKPSSKLDGKSLSVPALPPPYLRVNFSDKTFETSNLSYQNDCKLPSAASDIICVPVSSAKVLTHVDAVKKTLLLSLYHKEQKVEYSPGDAISVVCRNNKSEVNLLLERLNVLNNATSKMELELIPDTKKRRAAVPAHIHAVTTLRYIFTHCVSIRDQPSKALLRALVEFTNNELEVRRLQELCSKEGASEYTEWIREKHISLLDLLFAFPSCHPPVERVIEFLPRLQPRPYSICSFFDENSESFDIVFNLVSIPAAVSEGHFYNRCGVCTGWLDDITRPLQDCVDPDTPLDIKIPIFLRTNQHFRPPTDMSRPLIMIGPGTGVAPFIGFLQQRASLKRQMAEGESYGETWLFYGCRNREKDFLFRHDLEEFLSLGVLTRLCIAVSRDEGEPYQYVQDYISAESPAMAKLLDNNSLIYVCGDAQNMAKDVGVAFEHIMEVEKGLSSDDAHLAIMKKRLDKSYLEDVWV